VCGIEYAQMAFLSLDSNIQIKWQLNDGDSIKQGQFNPSMYRYIHQSHVTPQQVYGAQFIHSREVPTSHINQNSQTRRANQAARTKSSNSHV
jgi:hypothetical protein